MTGGDHSKPPAQKPPSSSAAQSGGGSRKSRWSSSNNNDGVGVGVNIKNSNSTAGQKSAEKRPWRPNPSPKPGPATPSQAPPKHPNSLSDPSPRSGPAPIPPPAPFSFPDPAALGPPPPPSYGFHMLERRSIVLADGSVRSYFALPPDYQDFPPPPRYVDPIGNRFLGPEFGRFPPPISPEGFRDRREHWDRADVSMKRKYPGEEEHDRRNERGELNGQRQQFMQYPNSGASSPFRRSFGEDMRAPKHMRVGSGGYESGGQVPKNLEVDQVALKKLFLHYVKLVYENPAERKKYLEDGKRGRLQCLVCGRSSKDVEDIHGMIMHAYGSDDGNKRVDHLGLHRALCLVMGWDFSKVPDHSKAYQILPTEVAAANRDDLIIWPPHVIVHNTSTGKGKEERMEGYGNKAMDNIIRDMIEELIRRGQQLDAVHFTYEVGLTDKFPPVPLLKAYLRDAKKAAASIMEDPNSNPGRAPHLAVRKEQSALRAIVKCIEEYKLEEEFPPENLKKRLDQLEKAKTEKRKPAAVPANKRTRAGYNGPMPPAKAGRSTNAYVSSFPPPSAYTRSSPTHSPQYATPSYASPPPSVYSNRSPPYPYSPEAAGPPVSYPGSPIGYPPAAYGGYFNGPAPPQAYHHHHRHQNAYY